MLAELVHEELTVGPLRDELLHLPALLLVGVWPAPDARL
jgi:hypothetical protein